MIKIANIANAPFAPTHIGGKKIQKIFFKKIAIAY